MKKIISVFSLSVGVFAASTVFAAVPKYKGMEFGDAKNDPYWFKMGGTLQLDGRIFGGNKKSNLHSGAYIRKFDIDLAGGLGKDLSFTAGFGFDAISSKVNVNDAYITYGGYKGLGDNFNVSIGKVNPSFCVEATSSSKWIPFLEKSMAVTAFSPDPGLGFSVSKWQKDYSLGLTLTFPKPTDTVKDANSNDFQRSDRVQISARGTKAHFWEDHKLVQLGFSGNFQDDHGSGIEFSTAPESKSRNKTDMLLNTTKGKKLILANSHYVLGLELLGQNGPFTAQAEGFMTRVNRNKLQSNLNPKFKSYYANINYVLTGESREFKNSSGTLGRVMPDRESGAWEISGRYSFLNLNDKDIVGGSDRSIGMAFTWYANYNIAVTGEYMKHHAKKSTTLEKLNFDSIGARLQLVF
jgi:phosphate-selective porin OprO and OprP